MESCGRSVDALKYQSALLHNDEGKCAQKLLDLLFDTAELVNGNPSGHTNSTDPARQKGIKRLCESPISYICGKYGIKHETLCTVFKHLSCICC